MAEADNFPELAQFYQEEGHQPRHRGHDRQHARARHRARRIPPIGRHPDDPGADRADADADHLEAFGRSLRARALEPLAFLDTFLDMALHGLLPAGASAPA
jgi:hypothetical protein